MYIKNIILSIILSIILYIYITYVVRALARVGHQVWCGRKCILSQQSQKYGVCISIRTCPLHAYIEHCATEEGDCKRLRVSPQRRYVSVKTIDLSLRHCSSRHGCSIQRGHRRSLPWERVLAWVRFSLSCVRVMVYSCRARRC